MLRYSDQDSDDMWGVSEDEDTDEYNTDEDTGDEGTDEESDEDDADDHGEYQRQREYDWLNEDWLDF